MPAAPSPAWLTAAGLPRSWHETQDWRVLDTNFGCGERFLELWHACSIDVPAYSRVHVVALSAFPPKLEDLQRTALDFPASDDLYRELAQQWFGLLPGFQRMSFCGGRLQLTVCVGSTLPMLRQQMFLPDSVVVGAPLAQLQQGAHAVPVASGLAADRIPWDALAIKSLARICRRGTILTVLPEAGLNTEALQRTGWQERRSPPAPDGAGALWCATYDPGWTIKSTRSPWAKSSLPMMENVVVIGGGLAGGAVADALARRGRQVTVLDAGPAPGSGASGLPVGLFAPLVSRDDGPRSRLSRAGIRMTLLSARRLLQEHQDWALGGVAHLINGNGPALPADWPDAGKPWARYGSRKDKCESRGSLPSLQTSNLLLHAIAGWIKPLQLVNAWLSHTNVRCMQESPVHAITLEEGHWQLMAADGRLLANAPQLVIASAGNSWPLVQMALAAAGQEPCFPHQPVTATHGQVSWAMHRPQDAECFPQMPVNGSGSVVGHVPFAEGAAWFAGATYESASATPLSVALAHSQNLARMNILAPDAARAVASDFFSGDVQAWRGTRWATHDRMPLVGPLPLSEEQPLATGLWISTAMGSRGLTYAALCGELIAARMGGEPLPIDAALMAVVDVLRLQARARS